MKEEFKKLKVGDTVIFERIPKFVTRIDILCGSVTIDEKPTLVLIDTLNCIDVEFKRIV